MSDEPKDMAAVERLKDGFEIGRKRSKIESAVVWIEQTPEGRITLSYHGDPRVVQLIELSVRQSQRYQKIHFIRQRVAFQQWLNRLVLRVAGWRTA